MQSELQAGRDNSHPNKAMRLLIAGLIVVSTILFVVGVAIERGRESGESAAAHQESQEGKAAPTITVNSGEGSEEHEKQEASGATSTPVSGEAAETHVEGGEGTTSETTAAKETHSSEAVFGIDTENPVVVAVYVIGWLVLLIALFMLGRAGLALVLAASAVALVFDLAEVMRQVGMSATLVAAIALLVAVCHAAIVALAIMAFIRSRLSPAPPQASTP